MMNAPPFIPSEINGHEEIFQCNSSAAFLTSLKGPINIHVTILQSRTGMAIKLNVRSLHLRSVKNCYSSDHSIILQSNFNAIAYDAFLPPGQRADQDRDIAMRKKKP
jgi:hypothetical protein